MDTQTPKHPDTRTAPHTHIHNTLTCSEFGPRTPHAVTARRLAGVSLIASPKLAYISTCEHNSILVHVPNAHRDVATYADVEKQPQCELGARREEAVNPLGLVVLICERGVNGESVCAGVWGMDAAVPGETYW